MMEGNKNQVAWAELIVDEYTRATGIDREIDAAALIFVALAKAILEDAKEAKNGQL